MWWFTSISFLRIACLSPPSTRETSKLSQSHNKTNCYWLKPWQTCQSRILEIAHPKHLPLQQICLFFGFLELLYHAIFSSIQLCFIKISSPTPSPSIFLDLWHDIFQFSPFDLLNFNILLVLKGALQHKMIEKAGVKKSCLDLVYFSRTNRIVHNLWKWVLFCIWSLVPN